jgi:hypothetical protein
MYLRFQGRVPNLGTASRLGIFQLAIRLRDSDEVPDFAHKELVHHLDWLNTNLISPEILKTHGHYRAISWFKPDAKAPLQHIWPIKAVLEDHGFPIDVITTKLPGVVIYQDGWQIIAKPFRRSCKWYVSGC